MPRTDAQPTKLSDPVGTGAKPTPASEAPTTAPASRARKQKLPYGVARKTGVVLVHGIGTQGPAETFLDWTGPIVELLTDWRQARDGAPLGEEAADRIDDPVWRAEFAFNAASPPYLELTIPADGQHPDTTWVFTEAWWASDLRAPSLGRTIDYLRRRMTGVVGGIATGYRERTRRLKDRAADDALVTDELPRNWRLIDALDLVQAKTFGARPVGWVVGIAGTIALGGYDLLRHIPFGPIREFAIGRMVDSFLVDWFGDLPVLLDDPVQAANVRARLARSIERLERDGCDAIVVVAHSGGALVTFETLLDPAYKERRVDKLVTLGQGLGLAWRLAADEDAGEVTPGDRLVGNLARIRPSLRWVDVWASYDPAPAGPLPARGGLKPTADEVLTRDGATVAVVQTGEMLKDGKASESWLLRADAGMDVEAVEAFTRDSSVTGSGPHIVVESRPVTNEMNVLTDHGTYWANPEGFLIPLVRHLDAAQGPSTQSRFYTKTVDRTRRILWRRQRVAVLATWGWLASLLGAATALALVLLQATGDQRLTIAGDSLAVVIGMIPGVGLITGIVDAVGAVVSAAFAAVGLESWLPTIASLGPPFVAVVFVIALFYIIVKLGAGRWHDWDRRERRAMLPEVPTLPDRSKAAAQAVALVGGLLGLVAACFGGATLSAALFAAGGLAGLAVWAARPFAD